MFSKRDFILSNISMKEILNKYGIKKNRDMFCCPFHKDDYPSAKCYDSSYFCFGCGQKGDLIQFVQDYFNLDFISAMEKINIDFNLNIPKNNKINYKELKEMEQKQKIIKLKKEQKQMEKKNSLLFLCSALNGLQDIYKTIKDNINSYNWETSELICSYIEQELAMLEIEFNDLNTKSDY